MKKFRINREITAQEVRLVLEDKTAKVVNIEEAMAMALNNEKDLIEIFPDAVPPVCKILNYEKFMYQLQKEEKEHKKKSKSITLKEVQFGLTIGPGDYKTKLDKTLEFIEEGHKVQLVILLKKKQLTMTDKAEALMKNILDTLGDKIKVEKAPFIEKKKCAALIGPQGKKKAPKIQDNTEKTSNKQNETSSKINDQQ